MNYRQNVDHVWFDPVDNSIRLLNYLSHVFCIKFWRLATGEGKIAKLD